MAKTELGYTAERYYPAVFLGDSHGVILKVLVG